MTENQAAGSLLQVQRPRQNFVVCHRDGQIVGCRAGVGRGKLPQPVFDCQTVLRCHGFDARRQRANFDGL